MHRWFGSILRRTRASALAVVCVTAAVAGSVAVRPSLADEVACDAKRVVKVLYCEGEGRIIEKSDLASGKTEYRCTGCNKAAPREGQCKSCNQALEKREHPKGSCSRCGKEPVKADACQREAYACPKCDDKALTKGKCPTCSVSLKKKADLALVKYTCAGCGTSALASGKCTKEGCSSMGKALDATCTASGTAPHVKEHKEKKPKKPKKEKKEKRKKGKKGEDE